jgi:hypothetical protein
MTQNIAIALCICAVMSTVALWIIAFVALDVRGKFASVPKNLVHGVNQLHTIFDHLNSLRQIVKSDSPSMKDVKTVPGEFLTPSDWRTPDEWVKL